MQIKFLAGEGVPKSRIAKRLGVTRQTVYKHLARTEPFPKQRPKRGSKLDVVQGVYPAIDFGTDREPAW